MGLKRISWMVQVVVLCSLTSQELNLVLCVHVPLGNPDLLPPKLSEVSI